jgi:transposase
MASATSTELTDEQWKQVKLLLPPKAKTGRPRANDRNTINGILWVARTGARWADMPRKYGAPSTCHLRLQTWQKNKVWEKIWQIVLTNLEKENKLDWSLGHIDASFIPAKKGAK